MLKGLANLGTLMRQAQQMGGRMQELTQQLKTKRVTGSSGGGMVSVEVNGLGEVLRLTIDPDLVARNERDMIEDLIPAAVNQAIGKSKQLHAEAVKSLANGLEIPGLDEAINKFAGTESESDEA